MELNKSHILSAIVGVAVGVTIVLSMRACDKSLEPEPEPIPEPTITQEAASSSIADGLDMAIRTAFAEGAYDSEDAGLLQYAKTLDSLETKLNSLATSFQQFYMKIINGDTFKGMIELITSIVDGFGQLGNLNSILSVFTLVRGLRIVLNTANNLLASTFNTIYKNYKDL